MSLTVKKAGLVALAFVGGILTGPVSAEDYQQPTTETQDTSLTNQEQRQLNRDTNQVDRQINRDENQEQRQQNGDGVNREFGGEFNRGMGGRGR
jgi:predicted transglutaminase-like cysteine proteinase